MKRVFLFSLVCLASLNLVAQDDLAWWDALHNYPAAAGNNRVRYQNISPGFFGPNALRVVPLRNGKIEYEYWLQVSGDVHRGDGDKTENLYLELNLVLAKNRVLLYVNSIPYEYYRVTSDVRDLRRMLNFSGEGSATGDMEVGTVFRVFVEENAGFNMTGRVHMKTTTGSHLGNARYTDHGMYVFDAQFSKTLLAAEEQNLLIKVMLGFMTWQTNKNRLPNGSKFLQNDAPVYGVGLEYTYNKWFVGSDFSGYHGYIGNRDYPHFWRTQAAYRFKDFELRSEFNVGVKKWDWNTFRLSARWYFAEAK